MKKRRAKVKPKTRAVEHYTKFALNKAIEKKKSELQDSIKSLKEDAKLHRFVRRLEFPCSIRYTVNYNNITFYQPSSGWKNDREFHRTLASLVKQLGRMERKFSDYSGNYYWIGTTEKGLGFTLFGAVKPENCEVVSYQETVTKYKSVCGKADKKTVA